MDTHATVAELLRRIGEGDAHPESAAVQISRILVDGPDAVVMGTIANTATRTGTSYLARSALHVTVEDGLVTRHHVYEDSLAVARAWAP